MLHLVFCFDSAIREVCFLFCFVCIIPVLPKSSFIAFVPRNSILIGIGSGAGAQFWRCRHISFEAALSPTYAGGAPYTTRYNTHTRQPVGKLLHTLSMRTKANPFKYYLPLFPLFLFGFLLLLSVREWCAVSAVIFPIVLLQSDMSVCVYISTKSA